MGARYGVICNACGTHFDVSEGSGMIAMPFHCDRCGKAWWWLFGPDGPRDKKPDPPPCDCGRRFTSTASPRCPECRSDDFREDPQGEQIMFD